MKVKRIHWLPVVSLVFAVFVAVFFIGRNLFRTPARNYGVRTVSASQSTGLISDTSGIKLTPDHALSAELTSGTTPDAPPTGGLININTATLEQLDSLPGIGTTLAQRIIDYREANGPYASVGALINVSGIGEKKLEAIWDLVTVKGE